MKSSNQSSQETREPKPPPIFITGVKNIKPLIELLQEIAENKYAIKTLSNDQVKVQPTEAATYTTIIKALMDRNTEFHTYKPKKGKTFRAVLIKRNTSYDRH